MVTRCVHHSLCWDSTCLQGSLPHGASGSLVPIWRTLSLLHTPCFTSSSSHRTFIPPTPTYNHHKLPSTAFRLVNRLCTFPEIHQTNHTTAKTIMENLMDTKAGDGLKHHQLFQPGSKHLPFMTQTSLLMRLACQGQNGKMKEKKKKRKETAPNPPLRHSCDS